MKKNRAAQFLATTLALSLLLSTAAQAITLEDAQALLSETYINTIPDEAFEQETISDMLATLGDPYTVYYTAEEYAAFLSTMEDSSIVGIGIVSSVTDEGLEVLEVYADSPAEKGGLVAGDILTAVDGTSIVGLDTDTVTEMLRGNEGTSVRITYLRGTQRRTAFLTRAEIIIPATASTLIDDHIGYFDCTTFGGETYDHFVEGFEAYGSDADRWIVDLTGNSGGDVSAATQSVSCFTGSTYTAFLRDADGLYGVYVPEYDSLTLAPVIVLTDSASASASELYAAAVRDLNAGLVVGWRTFGKGIAQVLLDENSYPEYFDGDAMKVSSYYFFSASGNATNSIGVIPDLMLDPNLADDVAVLLSSSNPSGDTSTLLRVDFGWRWIVDLEQATSEEYLPAFTAMLEAMPSTVSLWQGVGSVNDWTATSVEQLAATYGIELESRSFTDTDTSPYATQIDLLANYYILQGMGDGTFNPTGTLTRAQLCSMLAQALNCIVPEGDSPFADVPNDSDYADAIHALANLGLVNGMDDGLFHPDESVTHEQFITIMGRLIEMLNMDMSLTQENRSEDALTSATLASYSDWSQAQVWLLAESQQDYFGNTISILWDDLANISPSAATTREEAACLLYNVLSYIGILPV